jgi:hypothetical protein
MADLYLKSAGGNYSAAATWSATGSGGADSAGPPTAADRAILEAGSGQLTIDAASVCRSLDCTAGTGDYNGIITHNAFTLSIGDGTSATGNKALVLRCATYTLANATTSAIAFVSTSATVQTVDYGGKTTGNVTFNATSGGSWQYSAGHTTGATATVTLTKGTLDINGQTCSWGKFDFNNTNIKTLTLGASAITITGVSNAFAGDGNNTTITANTSTITFTGTNVSIYAGGSYNMNGSSFVMTGAGNGGTTGAGILTITCANFTRTGTAAKTDGIPMGSTVNLTCTGTFTCNGNSTINRIIVSAGTVGTARTITAATVVCSNTDFQDITGAGAGSWDFSARTDIGDCGGNSGITFPASVAQTWNGASGGNWSTNAWTTRVPLPQDDVSLGVAFSASQTVSCDMPRLGRSISWVGATGSPTFTNGSTAVSIFGSNTFISAMTVAGTGTITFAGRSNYNLYSNGQPYTGTPIFVCPTGTYTLQDSFITGRDIIINSGGFNSNDKSVTCGDFSTTAPGTRTITLGTSNVTTTWNGASIVFNLSTVTGLTFSGASSTINIVTTGTSTRTFAGVSQSFGTLNYILSGSTGELDITGSNSFAAINFSDASNARSLKFTKATNTTIRNGNGFNVRGTTGKLMTIDTIDGAGTFTLTSTNVQSTDYMNVIRSIVDASPKWYAGANSTDGTGNTNWNFTAAPATGGGSKRTLAKMNLLNILRNY